MRERRVRVAAVRGCGRRIVVEQRGEVARDVDADCGRIRPGRWWPHRGATGDERQRLQLRGIGGACGKAPGNDDVVELPRRHEPVGGKRAHQRAVGDAVHVLHELVDARAQLVEVQVRIARDERIPGPVHDADAHCLASRALPGLQPSAQPAAAQFRNDGQHIAPVGEHAVADACQPEDKADKTSGRIEGAGRDPANLGTDLEDGRRDELGESRSPGRLLEGHALPAILVADEVANGQVGSGRDRGGVHILNLMPDLRHYQRGVLLAASLLVALALPAQDKEPPVRAPFPVSWKDAERLGVFTLAAVAAMPLDRDGQRLMQRRWVQDSPVFSSTADVFNAYGSPGVLAGSAALYAAGWATGRPDLARLGMRAGEAIAVSGMLTGSIKGVAGRARPYASPGESGDFRLMSGVNDGARQSFPSGHATAAFAFAAAMDRELRRSHPKVARWAGPSLYAAAALTSLARMHSDNHWASDVVMGAGIGTVSGLMVARFHANRPLHWIDRRFLPRARR
ncbi:MAG: hypothetical protein C0497_04820 [Gemmatimonas sp.]|nr:hypothetical protein [Gemmatimonas sp.]